MFSCSWYYKKEHKQTIFWRYQDEFENIWDTFIVIQCESHVSIEAYDTKDQFFGCFATSRQVTTRQRARSAHGRSRPRGSNSADDTRISRAPPTRPPVKRYRALVIAWWWDAGSAWVSVGLGGDVITLAVFTTHVSMCIWFPMCKRNVCKQVLCNVIICRWGLNDSTRHRLIDYKLRKKSGKAKQTN